MAARASDIPLARAGTEDAIVRLLDGAAQGGQAALDEATAKAVLARLGIAVPRGLRLAPDESPAARLDGLRPPFVLKALSGTALHKSDIGAVQLGLRDATEVAEAAAAIAERVADAGVPLSGLLVEEMAAPGVEIVIGGTTDAQLGPMLMLGAGGVFAEILQDVSFRLCPIEQADATQMLDELRIAPILRGTRGRPAVDLAAITRALLALGGPEGFFTLHQARVAEFDLNPLIARPDGLVAVDARIVLTEGQA
jgi:acetate---CoA ligase (ADP-forming) subunit beta